MGPLVKSFHETRRTLTVEDFYSSLTDKMRLLVSVAAFCGVFSFIGACMRDPMAGENEEYAFLDSLEHNEMEVQYANFNDQYADELDTDGPMIYDGDHHWGPRRRAEQKGAEKKKDKMLHEQIDQANKYLMYLCLNRDRLASLPHSPAKKLAVVLIQ